MAVLGLADRTVNTRMAGRSNREVELVYARLAVERADHVASLTQDNHGQVRRAIATAWECILNPDATDRIGALNLADAIPVAMPSSDSTSKDVMVAVSSAARIAAHYANDSAMGFKVYGMEISSAAPAITVQRSLGVLNAEASEACQSQLAQDAHSVIDRFRELAGLPEAKPKTEAGHAREQGGELASAL
jgi:hypothetical protein